MAVFDKKNIIKIDDDDIKDARLSSIDFVDESTKKRAFINVLGARLAMKMLFSKKIEADNVYSLYTIHNVLEELDIADIYIQDIKIDIRLIFDKEQIFIPKSHFQYDIIPDLYLILQLKEDFSCVEPLGFFEPKEIDKNNQNSECYFYEYEELNNVKNLKTFLKNYSPLKNASATTENIEKTELLFLSLIDKEISQEDKGFLFKQLADNISLREKFVELENFEIISKETAKSENLLQDGVLDIVAAQQVFDDESANATKQEVKAEVIGEVLSDLILDENTIEENPEEKEVKPKTEEDEDFMKELLGQDDDDENDDVVVIDDKDDNDKIDSKKEPEEIKFVEKTDILQDVISGVAAGSAIAGGIVASEALTAEEDILEVLSSGIDLANKVIDKSSEAATDIIENIDDFLENFENNSDSNETITSEEQEIEQYEDKDDDKQDKIEEVVEEIKEIELDLGKLDTELNLKEAEIILEEQTKSEIKNSSDDIFNLDSIDFSALDDNIHTTSNYEADTENKEDDLLEQSNEIFKTSDEFSDLDLIKPEEETNQNIENLDSADQITSISSEENSQLNEIISPIPDIDGLISSGEFSFESLKEKVDETLFEDKPNFEAYGIKEEDLHKIQESDKIDNLKENINDDSQNINFNSPDYDTSEKITFQEIDTPTPENISEDVNTEEIGILPELDMNVFDSQKEFPIENQAQADSKNTVFDLNDFDFDVLDNEIDPEFKNEIEEAALIKNKILNEDFDYENIERQIEEEEEKQKQLEKERLAKEKADLESINGTETDDFLSQVDDFLNNVDISDEDLLLVGKDNNSIESTLNSLGISNELADKELSTESIPFDNDMVFDTSSFASEEDEEVSSVEKKNDETLQLLFKGKQENRDKKPEDNSSTRKDKKMVIAASVASVVLVSVVIGGGIISSHKANVNNISATPIAVQNQIQDTTQNPDMNIDLSQQVPDMSTNANLAESIDNSQQVNTPRDMGQAVSDAFSSGPVNASISKIAWEIPEDLAYNDGFRSYLQIAGKNLKLNLQNNLLMATEMAYSNKVIINLNISGDGSLQSLNIATSSGSKQIDKIVLQSVKETLMYLKMPSNELRGKSINSTLIINF